MTPDGGRVTLRPGSSVSVRCGSTLFYVIPDNLSAHN